MNLKYTRFCSAVTYRVARLLHRTCQIGPRARTLLKYISLLSIGALFEPQACLLGLEIGDAVREGSFTMFRLHSSSALTNCNETLQSSYPFAILSKNNLL